MNILEQVEEMKTRAVELLLAERKRIDEQLEILQPDKKAPAKRGLRQGLSNRFALLIVFAPRARFQVD